MTDERALEAAAKAMRDCLGLSDADLAPDMVTPVVITAYLSALPIPDEGLVDRLWALAARQANARRDMMYMGTADPEILEAADTITRLSAELREAREALDPFAEVADWAERNGHDLEADYDMLLRGPGNQIAGHLQAQAKDFVRAKAALPPKDDKL